MSVTVIHNVSIYPDEYYCLENGSVVIENGKIREISRENVMIPDAEYINGMGMNLLPGYIDVHVHGGYGLDFDKDTAECVRRFSENTVREGCTSFLASTVAEYPETYFRILEYFARKEQLNGAECLGVHLEGPFINPDYKAVMKPECIRLPDLNEFRKLIEVSDNTIRQMTIAPELEGAMELIEYGSDHGISMMLGHSGASSQTALEAVKKGARGLTHMYNAMSPHLHREPGMVTAGFLCDDLICELICDGFHVSFDVVKATIRYLKDHIALITDGTIMRGMPDGYYDFSGNHVHKDGIKATVVETGRISGSVIGMDVAVRNVRRECQISLNEIVKMASMNPALIAGVSDHKGRIAPGYDADMILLDRNDNVVMTFVAGKCVFSSL